MEHDDKRIQVVETAKHAEHWIRSQVNSHTQNTLQLKIGLLYICLLVSLPNGSHTGR
jgi:hypothetical protein